MRGNGIRLGELFLLSIVAQGAIDSLIVNSATTCEGQYGKVQIAKGQYGKVQMELKLAAVTL